MKVISTDLLIQTANKALAESNGNDGTDIEHVIDFLTIMSEEYGFEITEGSDNIAEKRQVNNIEKTFDVLNLNYYIKGSCPKCKKVLCGHVYEIDDMEFCPRCGQELKWSEDNDER